LFNSKLNGRTLGFNTPLSVFSKDTATRYTASGVEPRFRSFSITSPAPQPSYAATKTGAYVSLSLNFVLRHYPSRVT